MVSDPVGIVEAAYTWQPDDRAWLASVVDRCVDYQVGGGVAGYLVRVGQRTDVVASYGTASDAHTSSIRAALTSLPPALARQALQPTEFVGNGAYRLSRIARSSPKDMANAATTTARTMPPMWALLSGDVASRVLVVAFPRRGPGSPSDAFPHAESRTLGLAGAHLGAALRLRELAQPSANDDETDAVLTPRGKLLHARTATVAKRLESSLAHAVLASERARSRSKSATPEQALGEWTALVQGRWTILHTMERDGKRLVLARKNRMHGKGIDLHSLTADERDVVWLATLGHSYKYIAYELGLPIGTVSGRLRRAMAKLRVRSRSELLQRLGVTPPGGDSP